MNLTAEELILSGVHERPLQMILENLNFGQLINVPSRAGIVLNDVSCPPVKLR